MNRSRALPAAAGQLLPRLAMFGTAMLCVAGDVIAIPFGPGFLMDDLHSVSSSFGKNRDSLGSFTQIAAERSLDNAGVEFGMSPSTIGGGGGTPHGGGIPNSKTASALTLAIHP